MLQDATRRSAGGPEALELELGVAEFGAAGVRCASGRSSPRGSAFMTLRPPDLNGRNRDKMLPCELPGPCPLRLLPSPPPPPPPPPPTGVTGVVVAGTRGGTLPTLEILESQCPSISTIYKPNKPRTFENMCLPTSGKYASPGGLLRLGDCEGSRMPDAGVSTKAGGRRGEPSAASSNSSSLTPAFKFLEPAKLLVRLSEAFLVWTSAAER